MRTHAIRFGAVCLLFLEATGAAACEAVADGATGSPLLTRKPVRSEEARLTSGFGLRRHPILGTAKVHTGIDWAVPSGTPVLAAAGGRVVFAGVQGEFGTTVILDHGAGWRTLYANLSSLEVREDDCVAALAVIGRSGATGLSVGPMLHFEVQRDGRPIDPMQFPSQDPAPAEEAK